MSANAHTDTQGSYSALSPMCTIQITLYECISR